MGYFESGRTQLQLFCFIELLLQKKDAAKRMQTHQHHFFLHGVLRCCDNAPKQWLRPLVFKILEKQCSLNPGSIR